MRNYKGKVVVVTGAGSGIGRAVATEFSRLGAKLAIMDFNKTGLNETKKNLPGNTDVYSEVFDISEKETVFAFADHVINHFGCVDVVINNAGIKAHGLLELDLV